MIKFHTYRCINEFISINNTYYTIGYVIHDIEFETLTENEKRNFEKDKKKIIFYKN